MITVQPGKVPTYEPSTPTTLTGYNDSNRTRFLYTGSQFVKAVLVTARPDYAYVGSVGWTGLHTITWQNYKTSDGKYALVNDEKYIPEATGAPTSGSASTVIVSFPVQVSTDEIVLWSTDHITFYDQFSVQYSYDGSFYFDVASVSTTFGYDATVYKRAGDEVDKGEYYYTISLDSTYTARYFRITTAITTGITATLSPGGPNTINVTSATDFPSSWSSYAGFGIWCNEALGSETSYLTYTGKTDTSFTGVTWEDPNTYEVLTADTTVTFRASFAEYLTEVEVKSVDDPILEVWNNDGTQASSIELDETFYYDVVYDKAENVFFTIRLNESFDGSGGLAFSPSDNFNYSTSQLNTTRWTESTTYPNFLVNTTSGTLDYLVGTTPGMATTNYYLDGDFTSYIETGFNRMTSSNSRLELRSINDSTNNIFVQMGIRGPWIHDGAQTGVWEALQIRTTADTTGGTASVRNMRIDTTTVSGSQDFTLVYDQTSDIWSVTSSLIGAMSSATPGEDYSNGPLIMNVVHSSDPADGAQIVMNLNHQQYPLPTGSSSWDWRIGLDKSGTDVICKYDPGTGSFTDWVTYTDSSDLDLNLELYADGSSDTIDISLDNFTVTGTDLFSDVPVFTIEAVDFNGDVVEVSGLTDSDGYLIKKFDVVNEELSYNSFIGDRVQIATDGIAEGAGGAFYIKIKEDLYKYSKTLFPLDLEDGSTATLFKEDVIPETDAIAFSFNSYSNAGLCYVEYDDERSGTYLKTIDTSTVSGTDYESYLDVTSASYPFAWDINNYTTLYYVDGTSLKEYDMDEDDVAFCNVSSAEKIMSAGTSETSTISATVLNVYGEILPSKTVSFSVSAGAGAVSPSSACTNASGVAQTTYTVGSSVGTTTITAAASDTSC